jgi:hypothetical protein
MAEKKTQSKQAKETKSETTGKGRTRFIVESPAKA